MDASLRISSASGELDVILIHRYMIDKFHLFIDAAQW